MSAPGGPLLARVPLLPPNLSTLSAAVPSGQYHIAVVGANGCGKSDYDDIYFTVP